MGAGGLRALEGSGRGPGEPWAVVRRAVGSLTFYSHSECTGALEDLGRGGKWGTLLPGAPRPREMLRAAADSGAAGLIRGCALAPGDRRPPACVLYSWVRPAPGGAALHDLPEPSAPLSEH